MKSLNRTLSLVLVLAMCLGLMGIASAAAFTDNTAIQYNEAVTVMTGIGAINGYSDGTFAPKGTITREEAAKLIAYSVLGATVAKTLSVTATGFSDVAASRWSAPYISYCVGAGIINGMGDGTFAPTANVTGYQLAKMLLCAVGYGKQGEFTGASWELNTAILANKTGIYENAKTVNFSAAATREEAALYCFNAITAVGTVKYSKDLSDYVAVLNATVPVTIATNVYSSLQKNASASSDSFGRPSNVWTYGTPAAVIAVSSSTPILKYTTGVTEYALNLAIKNAGYTPNAAVATVFNGVAQTATTDTTATSTSTKVGGNGTLVEVYGNSTTGALTKIVIVSSFVGSVTSITTDVASTTTVDERALTINTGLSTVTVSAAAKTPGFDAAYTAAVAANAAGKAMTLIVTPAATAAGAFTGTTAINVAVPTIKTLTASSYVDSTSFVADSATYTYAANCATSAKLTAGYAFTAFTAVIDSYGYVISTAAVDTTANYAYVLDLGSITDGWGATTYQAKLLYSDGTVAVVTTAADYTHYTDALGTHVFTNETLKGEVVTYSVNAAGKTVLVGSAAKTAIASSALTLVTGNASFTFGGGTKVANANTVFVIASTDSSSVTTFKAYKGIANVPGFTGTITGAIYATSGMSNYVFLNNATPAGTSSSDKIFVSHVGTAPVTTSTGTYYVAQAVVNGTIKTLNLTSDSAIGVYTVMTTGSTGLVTLSTSTGSALTSIAPAANGVIQINGTYYGYASDCAVYTFNATTGAITASSIAGITATSTGWFTVSSTTGLVTGIYLAVA